MKICVVSLPSSLERRQRMQNQLEKLNVDFEFFNAIDGSKPDFLNFDKVDNSLTFSRKGYHLKTGEIACFSSHYELWKHCVELNQPLIILEDNVDISDDFPTLIDTLSNEISRFGYIKLAATFPSKFSLITPLTDRYSLGQYRKKTCGTTAYTISPKAAKQLIQHAEKFIEPVDDYLEKPWRHGVKTYSIAPSLFQRAQIASTISSNSNHRKAKSGLSKLIKFKIELYRAYESVMRILFWNHRK
ncbi:TPA: glycosyltransferase family 25 protein [Vibrio vulnificus]|nr:glycosyltransferase family 25 protein [Vibrio vulnificus]